MFLILLSLKYPWKKFHQEGRFEDHAQALIVARELKDAYNMSELPFKILVVEVKDDLH